METTLTTYFPILEGVYETKFFDWMLRFRVIDGFKLKTAQVDQNLGWLGAFISSKLFCY